MVLWANSIPVPWHSGAAAQAATCRFVQIMPVPIRSLWTVGMLHQTPRRQLPLGTWCAPWRVPCDSCTRCSDDTGPGLVPGQTAPPGSGSAVPGPSPVKRGSPCNFDECNGSLMLDWVAVLANCSEEHSHWPDTLGHLGLLNICCYPDIINKTGDDICGFAFGVYDLCTDPAEWARISLPSPLARMKDSFFDSHNN